MRREKSVNPRIQYVVVNADQILVYLDGEQVGTIKPTKWAYFPQNKAKNKGEDFGSVKAVKESIEAE